ELVLAQGLFHLLEPLGIGMSHTELSRLENRRLENLGQAFVEPTWHQASARRGDKARQGSVKRFMGQSPERAFRRLLKQLCILLVYFAELRLKLDESLHVFGRGIPDFLQSSMLFL